MQKRLAMDFCSEVREMWQHTRFENGFIHFPANQNLVDNFMSVAVVARTATRVAVAGAPILPLPNRRYPACTACQISRFRCHCSTCTVMRIRFVGLWISIITIVLIAINSHIRFFLSPCAIDRRETNTITITRTQFTCIRYEFHARKMICCWFVCQKSDHEQSFYLSLINLNLKILTVRHISEIFILKPANYVRWFAIVADRLLFQINTKHTFTSTQTVFFSTRTDRENVKFGNDFTWNYLQNETKKKIWHQIKFICKQKKTNRISGVFQCVVLWNMLHAYQFVL